jgi:hypothetical protein
MTSIAKRTIAAVAIVAILGLGTPVVALASTSSTTTTTTSSTTTTIATKTPVITTMKQWRAADRLYLAKLKVINLTFLAAAATAKMNLSTSIGSASNATARISARATYRFAITEATIARSNALTLLGEPPLKPGKKPAVTTTTL